MMESLMSWLLFSDLWEDPIIKNTNNLNYIESKPNIQESDSVNIDLKLAYNNLKLLAEAEFIFRNQKFDNKIFPFKDK